MLKPLLKILSQPGPTLQAGFFYWYVRRRSRATEKKTKKRHFRHGMTRKRRRRKDIFATDEHGKTRKQNISFRAGSVSDGWRSIRISHGRTRKNTEEAEEKTFLPRRRQVRKERKAMSDAS
jgi:hypothetical protein